MSILERVASDEILKDRGTTVLNILNGNEGNLLEIKSNTHICLRTCRQSNLLTHTILL